MRPQMCDAPNARDLVNELDQATELMMSMPVELVGGSEWQDAFNRQQRAFRMWRDYLYRKADERPEMKLLNIA